MQQEHEKQMARKGIRLGKKKRIKIFRQKAKDDKNYVPSLESEEDAEDEEKAAEVKQTKHKKKSY